MCYATKTPMECENEDRVKNIIDGKKRRSARLDLQAKQRMATRTKITWVAIAVFLFLLLIFASATHADECNPYGVLTFQKDKSLLIEYEDGKPDCISARDTAPIFKKKSSLDGKEVKVEKSRHKGTRCISYMIRTEDNFCFCLLSCPK